MNKSFSAYLDLCRLFAALIVVFAHFVWFDISTGPWNKFVPQNGHDAVVLFFVLSGLVIYYTAERKKQRLTSFITDRAVRIYSVAIPIIIGAVVIDSIGIQFNEENYTGLYQYEKLYIYIPFHLMFGGELWSLSEQPFTVPPYWSLGYEVWYYALFAVLYFYSGIKRIIIFCLLFLLVGYKLWLLFPVWLAGVLLFRLIEKTEPNQFTAWLCFFSPIILYYIYRDFGISTGLTKLGVEIWPFELSLGSASNYLSDYVVCVLCCIHLYGARFLNFKWNVRLDSFIRTTASYTFTLYLAHAPIMLTIHHNFEIDTNSIWTSIVIFAIVIASTYAIGSVTEKNKNYIRPTVIYFLHSLKKVIIAIKIKRFLSPNKVQISNESNVANQTRS